MVMQQEVKSNYSEIKEDREEKKEKRYFPGNDRKRNEYINQFDAESYIGSEKSFRPNFGKYSGNQTRGRYNQDNNKNNFIGDIDFEKVDGYLGFNCYNGQYIPLTFPLSLYSPRLINNGGILNGKIPNLTCNYNATTFLPGMAPTTPTAHHRINNALAGTNIHELYNFSNIENSLMDIFSFTNKNSSNDKNEDSNQLVEKEQTNILEKFKEGKIIGLQLKDIKNDIEKFAVDQHGSRFIQSKFDEAGKEEKNAAFVWLLPYITKLSMDVFGNYIIQKLFISGSDIQRSQLLDILQDNILKLSLNQYGCRVIQKALETGDSDDALIIYNGIKNDIMRCMVDQHGNHVVQKVVYKIDPEYHQYIINSIIEHEHTYSIIELSLHQYACRVIQMMIEEFYPEPKELVTENLRGHIKTLLMHEFGNYVAQKIFTHGSCTDQRFVLSCICGELLRFSRNKYASNVIEVCLEKGNPKQVELIIKKVVDEPFDNLLHPMIADQYGNYVIQKMIDKADDFLKNKLIALIKPMQNNFMKHSFYKNVLLKCSAFK